MNILRNVLIVDDDLISQFISENVVTSLFEVQKIYKSGNGFEALKLMEQEFNNTSNVLDLILMDLEMPVMNGFELIEATGSMELFRRCNVKIIMITSSLNQLDREKAGHLKIKHYMQKPLTIARLMDAYIDLW